VPLEEHLPAVVDERLALLVDHRARLAGRGVDGDDAVHLVAALVVAKREARRVRLPADVEIAVRRVGSREQTVVDRHRAPAGNLDQARPAEFVTSHTWPAKVSISRVAVGSSVP